MTRDSIEIKEKLCSLLKEYCPPLRVVREDHDGMEVRGCKTVLQGMQQVEGHYFASVIPHTQEVYFYFFPIYSHSSYFEGLSAGLRKFLRRKNCFYIKKLDQIMEKDIRQMIETGVRIYTRESLI